MEKTEDHFFTDLDLQLQQLALVDWPTFVRLIGEDNILNAKVCLLKNRGKSHNQAAVKLNMSRDNVRYACKKCPKPGAKVSDK